MVRLRPVSYLFLVALLLFQGLTAVETSHAATVFGLASDSESSQVKGRPDTSKSSSSQVPSKALTIEKKTDKDFPKGTEDKPYPTYRNNDPSLRVSLPQAVAIAVARNLVMADSRLAVEEKEYQRREAYSDFFPSIDVLYNGTWDRYQNASYVSALSFVQDARHTGSQQFNLQWAPLSPPAAQAGTSVYPYRIDPYRQFTGSVTI
ncbi:MAG: hypothetical protein V1897_16520, partial [Pseudomonadota bacterium]